MTERHSPPTERVVQVLNLLAERPRERLSLTEITERLGLSKPTCLGILTTLAEAALVTRDADKAYALGPALLRLGAACEVGVAALDLIRPHVAALHRQLGLSCVVTAVLDNQVVVVEQVGIPTTGGMRELLGQQFPFAPPLGLANVVWNGDQAVDDWLSKEHLVPITEDRQVLREVVEDARRRGYLVEQMTGGSGVTPNAVLANLVASDLPAPVIAALRAHLPGADWSKYQVPANTAVSVAYLGAPIYDRRGTQRYAVLLIANRPDVPAATCRQWADALVATTRSATEGMQ